MSKQAEKVYEGVVVDEEETISIVHLSHNCNQSQDDIIELVEEGILEPVGSVKQEWHFHYKAISRIKKAKRLQRDFELDLKAIGLIIHLLDRIEELESKLKNLDY